MKTNTRIATLFACMLLTGTGSFVLAQDGSAPMKRGEYGHHGDKGPHGHMAAMLKELDADKDGTITRAEIDAHESKVFTDADTNADGFVSGEEMMAYREAKREEMRLKRMAERQKKMIAELDTNKDGLVSREEFMARPNPMFDRIDTNQDGRVDETEMQAAKEKGEKMMARSKKYREWREKKADQ